MTLDQEIFVLSRQYLECCAKISRHEEDEDEQRAAARILFHIVEELRRVRSTDLYRVA